jgi:hypothetical protein
VVKNAMARVKKLKLELLKEKGEISRSRDETV